MKPVFLRALILLGSVLLLGGCSSIDADAPRGAGLAKTQRFFVVSNLNDNHALGERIAAVLQARGLTASTGPLTMMPDNTQAIVTYQDHWSWDFGEHVDYLRLTVRAPDSNETLGGATYNSRVPGKESVAETVSQLVLRLFDRKAP